MYINFTHFFLVFAVEYEFENARDIKDTAAKKEAQWRIPAKCGDEIPKKKNLSGVFLHIGHKHNSHK